MEQTCQVFDIQIATLRRWIDRYLHGGFERLLQPITHAKPQQPSPQQKKLLGFIITHHAPLEYSFDPYVWTGVGCKGYKKTLNNSRIKK